MVFFNEVDYIHLFLRVKIVKQTLLNYLTNANEIVTTSLHGQINIVGTRYERLEVRRQLMPAINHGVKVIVGDEDYRAIEVK